MEYRETVTKKKQRGADNGKYALVIYFIANKACSLEEVIHLKPEKALELIDINDTSVKGIDGLNVLEELKRYMTSNINSINKKGYFFPGKRENIVSERSLLQELHYWLKDKGKSLKDYGLSLRTTQADVFTECDVYSPADVLKWAKALVKK